MSLRGLILGLPTLLGGQASVPAGVPEYVSGIAMTGYGVVGFAQTVTTGTWTGSPSAYTVNLYDDADDSLIASDLTTSFNMPAGAAGKVVKVGVIATNEIGSSTVAFGSPTSAAVLAAFDAQLAALSGRLATFPTTEASGATVDNAEGTAARDAVWANVANVLYQNKAFPFNGAVAYGNGFASLRFGTADLASNWNWDDFTILIFTLPDATQQAGTTKRSHLFMSGGAGRTTLGIYKDVSNAYAMTIDHRPNGSASGYRLGMLDWLYSPNYNLYALKLKSGVGTIYRRGVLVKTISGAIPASTTTTLDVSNAAYNSLMAGAGNALAAIPYATFCANGNVSESDLNNVWLSLYPQTKNLFGTGDSFLTDNDYWVNKLEGDLESQFGEVWRENPYRLGYSGNTVSEWYTAITTDLTAVHPEIDLVHLHIGTNDESAGTNETTFKTNYTNGLDHLMTKCPNADISVSLPWRSDVATPTSPATLKGWILDILALPAYSGRVFVGFDATGTYASDPATYTLDNCHPSNAGHVLIASEITTNYAAFLAA